MSAGSAGLPGLAPVIAPNGTLVVYSAALSSVVSDNGSDHSLFVQELLKEIRVPDLSAEEALNRTRLGVTRASNREQQALYFLLAGRGLRLHRHSRQRWQPSAPPPPAMPPPRATLAAAATAPPPPAIARRRRHLRLCRRHRRRPDRGQAGRKARATQLALADDPTIKSLTDKLNANPDDASALYRRGQVYASKGAYSLAIKDFDDTLRLNPKDVEALTIAAGRARWSATCNRP